MILQGRRKIGETLVPCLPLGEIVADRLGNRTIDVLNVDCEGMDLDVLASLDLAANRPMVVVVEDHAGFMALRDRSQQSEVDRFPPQQKLLADRAGGMVGNLRGQ